MAEARETAPIAMSIDQRIRAVLELEDIVGLALSGFDRRDEELEAIAKSIKRKASNLSKVFSERQLRSEYWSLLSSGSPIVNEVAQRPAAVPLLPTPPLIDFSTLSSEDRFPAAGSPAPSRCLDPALPATMKIAVAQRDMPSRTVSHQTPLLPLRSSQPTIVHTAQASSHREPRLKTSAGRSTVVSAGQKRLHQAANSSDEDDRPPPPQPQILPRDVTKTAGDAGAASACSSERDRCLIDRLQPDLPSISSLRGDGDAGSLVQQPALPLASAVCQSPNESNAVVIQSTNVSGSSQPQVPPLSQTPAAEKAMDSLQRAASVDASDAASSSATVAEEAPTTACASDGVAADGTQQASDSDGVHAKAMQQVNTQKLTVLLGNAFASNPASAAAEPASGQSVQLQPASSAHASDVVRVARDGLSRPRTVAKKRTVQPSVAKPPVTNVSDSKSGAVAGAAVGHDNDSCIEADARSSRAESSNEDGGLLMAPISTQGGCQSDDNCTVSDENAVVQAGLIASVAASAAVGNTATTRKLGESRVKEGTTAVPLPRVAAANPAALLSAAPSKANSESSRTTGATSSQQTSSVPSSSTTAAKPDGMLLNAGMTVYARRVRQGSPWDKAVIVNCRDGKYEVRFSQGALSRPLPLMHLARKDASATPSLGARVIALYREPRGSQRFYAGVVGEVPCLQNISRFLIFFDDGCTRYCKPNELRLIYKQGVNPWDDLDGDFCAFIKEYFKNISNRQMHDLVVGQRLEAEWDRKWWASKVRIVDASLVQVCFDWDNRYEWFYRGSKRLRPHSVGKPSQAPASEGSCSLNDRSASCGSVSSGDTDATAAASEVFSTPSANAARPTTAATSATSAASAFADQGPANSKVMNEGNRGKRMPLKHPYHVPNKGSYVPHTCNASCSKAIVMKLDGCTDRGPLFKPFVHGFTRIIFKMRYGRNKATNVRVGYRAPCGRMLRDLSEIENYLILTNSELSIDMFSITASVNPYFQFVASRRFHFIKDISYGKEAVMVSCVNDVDHIYPDYVNYMKERMAAYDGKLNTNPDFLSCCDCTDNCQDRSKCSCHRLTWEAYRNIQSRCSPETVGYKFKRLKGPLYTGIYECNDNCKCNASCPNRVIQFGLSLRLQVFKTLNRGWGIRCLDDIDAGTFICSYAGLIYTTDRCADEEGTLYGDEYMAELDYLENAGQYKDGYESGVDTATESSDSSEDAGNGNERDADYGPHSAGSDTDSGRRKRGNFATRQRRRERNIACKSGQGAVIKLEMNEEEHTSGRCISRSQQSTAAVPSGNTTLPSGAREPPLEERADARKVVSLQHNYALPLPAEPHSSPTQPAVAVDDAAEFSCPTKQKPVCRDDDEPIVIEDSDDDDADHGTVTAGQGSTPDSADIAGTSSPLPLSRPPSAAAGSQSMTRAAAAAATAAASGGSAAQSRAGDRSGPPAFVGIREYCGEHNPYVMDAKSFGNVGRYMNHSCEPNVFVQNVFVDTHDLRLPWVAFFTLRPIRAGEELTWDYGYEMGAVPGRKMFCCCGARKCRGRLL